MKLTMPGRKIWIYLPYFHTIFFVLASKFVLQQCMHLSKWTKDKSSKSAVGTEAWVRSNPNWMLV